MAFSWDLGITDLLGAGMDMLGDRMQYSYQKRLMNEQRKQNQEQEKWSALHLPSLRRQGYEDAGYNPLAAFSSNFGSANGVSQSGFSSNFGSGSLTSTMEANTSREQAKNQKEYQEAVVDNQKAEVENKQAETKVLQEQAEETRLNNRENRRMQSVRDRMSFLVDLLKQKMDFLKSSAGQTQTSFTIPGFFSRSESRDNYMSDNVLASLDAAIKKYGDGLFDYVDSDEPFDTILGTVTNVERTRKRVTHDLNYYINKFNDYLMKNQDKFWRGYYKGKRNIEEYKRNHPDRILQHKINQRKRDSDESIRIYRDYNLIPGLEPWRR